MIHRLGIMKSDLDQMLAGNKMFEIRKRAKFGRTGIRIGDKIIHSVIDDNTITDHIFEVTVVEDHNVKRGYYIYGVKYLDSKTSYKERIIYNELKREG